VDSIDCFYIVERRFFLRQTTGKNTAWIIPWTKSNKWLTLKNFFRINRNYLIQINAIQDIITTPLNRLGIKINGIDHLDLIVSRDKVSEFKKWLDR
jgi:DNA-binding LytR/AlgR family response regulator